MTKKRNPTRQNKASDDASNNRVITVASAPIKAELHASNTLKKKSRNGTSKVSFVNATTGTDVVPCMNATTGTDVVPSVNATTGTDVVPCVNLTTGIIPLPCASTETGTKKEPRIKKTGTRKGDNKPR
ncbi:hypothetical protein BROC_00379 [Candidatus Brocadiaceae bacterium]|nr:hypothetical protein BROC_00379 [Candidatus Brocadiaceae bacterium]